MSLSTFTDWFYCDWGQIKGYKIEFRTVSGVKQQRHNFLLSDGSIRVDRWIRATQ